MNPLVKKEIRLLLPGFLAVLLLEVVQPWFWSVADDAFGFAPVIFFFGMIILAVDSFGREFSLGTFQSLMSQPVGRRQIWQIKITVLFFAAALIFAGYFASFELLFHHALRIPIWTFNPTIIESDFRDAMSGSGAVMVVALAGGLWTTLLLRQIAAAFWIAFLVPAGLLLLIAFVMFKFFDSASDVVVFSVLYGAAGLYAVSAFWLAHRLFHRAQDVAWTGGAISFSKWRYFEGGSESSVSVRRRKPIAALAKKEFQLQSISLFCAAALLVLHIALIVMRKVHGNFREDSLAGVASDFFWPLWLIMPLVIGSTAVAEERKLGTAEGQFCLPVSRRVQFALKFFPAIFFGMLLGAFMPLLLEQLAALIGAPNPAFDYENNPGELVISGFSLFQIVIAALALGLSLAGFFASTLAKSFLQAMGVAVATIIACCLFPSFAGRLNSFFGDAWNPDLAVAVAILAALVIVPWLAYGNFRYFQERGRIWRRNVFGLAGAILFIFICSAALYNRVWEVFEPAEPPHGPAMFSPANLPALRGDGQTGLQVRLPDGRIWCDSLGYPYLDDGASQWKWFWWALVHPLPVSTGPRQFIAGSNWVSATTYRIQFWNPNDAGPRKVDGYLDTVGVQADGTLWISSEARPVAWTGARMMRFGDETNWLQVIRKSGGCLLLLKRDGTLWHWGTNNLNWSQWQTRWPTVRGSKPQQLGADSGWQEIFSSLNFTPARKNDGSVWDINPDWTMKRDANLDRIVLETFSDSGDNTLSYIGRDGTLWVSYNLYNESNDNTEGTRRYLQVGRETNWVATAMSWNWMVALKTDGTLWQWHFHRSSGLRFPEEDVKIPPTRLGIHNDWIGLTGTWDGAVTLAADGSLWFWPSPRYYEEALLKPPRHPQFLGNIFRGAH